MSELLEISHKATLRRQASARRKSADRSGQKAANDRLTDAILSLKGVSVVSGYMPIHSEIDPIPTMRQLHEAGKTICLPVIQGKARPLIFRQWRPDSAMIEGDFGALIPRGGEDIVPDTLITPLLAFDPQGWRLGYGGGFYDRTLELLRSNGPVKAIGFAFSAQEMANCPIEETDQRLDMVVTEAGIQRF